MTGPDGILLRTEALTRSFGSLMAVNRGLPHGPTRGAALDHRAERGGQDDVLPARSRGRWRRAPGRIWFQDEDITGRPQHAVCRLGVAKSYQITNIFPHLSVLENVRVAVQGHARAFNFWSRAGALAGVPGARGRAARHDRPRRQGGGAGGQLSHGEKRHLEIASRSPPIRCCCSSTSRRRA